MSEKFDPRDLRRTFGQFPTGVTIITTKKPDGELVGCTASSFNSVSVDPPLILWSVDKDGLGADIFKTAEYFAVNVLSRDQVDLSNKFASRGEDKFNGVEFKEGLGGSPVLEDCVAYFQCKTWNIYDGGDHWILVGEVKEYERTEDKSPLVFSQGSYSLAMQHPHKSTKTTVSEDNTKLPEYFLYLLRMAYSTSSSDFYPLLNAEFGIAPEEWRIVTLLSSYGQMTITQASEMTQQPLEPFNDTALLLSNNGLIDIDAEYVVLTSKGKTLAEKLFTAAKKHEQSMLESFNEQEITTLKKVLTHLADGQG